MSAYDPRMQSMGYHPRHRVSDVEERKREAVRRIAEQHFTAAEMLALMADMANGDVDVRIYDDGIVLMRRF
jgi:hypothetical protein